MEPGALDVSTVSAEQFAAVIVDVADTLVDDFDIIDFLHSVSVHTATLVDAAAVGMMLADVDGNLQFVTATQEAAAMLELFQLQEREGPCLDAFTSGKPVATSQLDTAGDRWPRFAPRAAAAGFTSVHALPMRRRDKVIGALNVFSAHERQLTAADLAVSQALADVATIGLLQERAIQRGALLAEQLQKALTSRIIIEQAKGALANMQQVSVDEAFKRLRSYARQHRLSLTALATSWMNAPDEYPELTRPS